MARPLKEIDWNKVELQMEAGCTAKQIAGSCRIDINTFYDRFKLKYKSSFSDYAVSYSECGKGNIMLKQYACAMKGSIPMLMHLGKHRLGQHDKVFEQQESNRNICVNFNTNSAACGREQVPVQTLPEEYSPSSE